MRTVGTKVGQLRSARRNLPPGPKLSRPTLSSTGEAAKGAVSGVGKGIGYMGTSVVSSAKKALDTWNRRWIHGNKLT